MDLRAMVDGDLSVIEGGAAPNPMKQHINEGADGPLGVAGAKKKKLKAGGPGSGRKPGDWRNAEVTGPERENWLALLKEVEKSKLARSPVRPEDQKHLGPTLYSEKKKKRLAAGGPGSGCKGPNCGRHAGGKGTDKTHVPKRATVSNKMDWLREQARNANRPVYDNKDQDRADRRAADLARETASLGRKKTLSIQDRNAYLSVSGKKAERANVSSEHAQAWKYHIKRANALAKAAHNAPESESFYMTQAVRLHDKAAELHKKAAQGKGPSVAAKSASADAHDFEMDNYDSIRGK